MGQRPPRRPRRRRWGKRWKRNLIKALLLGGVLLVPFLFPINEILKKYEGSYSDTVSKIDPTMSEVGEKARQRYTDLVLEIDLNSTITKLVGESPPPWTTINESLRAQALINDYRAQYGRDPLPWNEGLYKLAVSRSEDMYRRKYLDHTTPEGECATTFAPQFGIRFRSIAENVQGCEGNCYFLANPRDAVNGWMGSRGHRYNLLYPNHLAGAVGCYQSYCTFLGAHNDPYGLGAGGCYTADEGVRFWANAPRQPGEAISHE
jgi:uncharacterized protein YkwD